MAERCVDLDLTNGEEKEAIPLNTTTKVRDKISGVSVDKSGCLSRMFVNCMQGLDLSSDDMNNETHKGRGKKKNWEKATLYT